MLAIFLFSCNKVWNRPSFFFTHLFELCCGVYWEIFLPIFVLLLKKFWENLFHELLRCLLQSLLFCSSLTIPEPDFQISGGNSVHIPGKRGPPWFPGGTPKF